MFRRLFSPAAVAGIALASLALAAPTHTLAQSASAPPVNVRGKIVSIKDDKVVIKAREGGNVSVALSDRSSLASVVKAKVSDIKPGDFVGIASLPKTDGGDGALEVVIFPAALKGTNEGSFGWDLKPNSSMTNATVANAVKGVDGRFVSVTYNGKEKKISIPDNTPVVTLGPASKADLVPGETAFILAMKTPGGDLAGLQVVVGKDGIKPPM